MAATPPFFETAYGSRSTIHVQAPWSRDGVGGPARQTIQSSTACGQRGDGLVGAPQGEPVGVRGTAGVKHFWQTAHTTTAIAGSSTVTAPAVTTHTTDAASGMCVAWPRFGLHHCLGPLPGPLDGVGDGNFHYGAWRWCYESEEWKDDDERCALQLAVRWQVLRHVAFLPVHAELFALLPEAPAHVSADAVSLVHSLANNGAGAQTPFSQAASAGTTEQLVAQADESMALDSQGTLNTSQMLAQFQWTWACNRWGHLARNVLAAYANDVKAGARSKMITRRVLQRLERESHQTDLLHWLATDLAFKDPVLYFMQSEHALYDYVQRFLPASAGGDTNSALTWVQGNQFVESRSMHATSIHQGLRADSVAQPDYDMASASDSVVVPARNSDALHAAQTGLLMRTLNVGEGELFLQIWALVLAESVLTALRMRTIARQLASIVE